MSTRWDALYARFDEAAGEYWACPRWRVFRRRRLRRAWDRAAVRCGAYLDFESAFYGEAR